MKPPSSVLTDAEWMAQLRRGDPQAFRVFYNRYWYDLYRTAYFKTGRREVAEELTQEVFVRLWDKHATLLIDNVCAWLHTCLRHLVIDYIRRNAHEERYLSHLRNHLLPATPSTERDAEFNDLAEALSRALHQLPPKTEAIFRMSRFEQRPVADIARHMHLSEKAVEYHLTKALKYLREHLSDYSLLSLLLTVLDRVDSLPS